MDFQTTLTEIITAIKQQDYLNEAEVTNGIVLRILNQLNWNVYDTKKVKPQFRIDNKIIDFALCFPDNKPAIIIEVKALGKANNTDEQVLSYSFKTGIPVAILTDGQEWHFYLPAERGSLTERRFYKLDLLARTTSEIEQIFQSYLSYEAVRSGEALKQAKADYDKQYKSKEIDTSIPLAWDKLVQDQDVTLVRLLSEKVADICGYEPSDDKLIEYLKQLGKTSNYVSVPQDPIDDNDINDSEENANTNDAFRGVRFNNQTVQSRNAIGTLEALLKIAITNFPNSLRRIESQTQGRSRSLISKQKENLFIGRPDLVQDFSKSLPNNWWMGANYSKREIKQFCKVVVNSITQEYGVQQINWSL